MDRSRHLWAMHKRFLGFVGRVVTAFLRNRGILLAGGVGYNALLLLVPFLTLTVATLSLFFDKQRILGILRPQLRIVVPQHKLTVCRERQVDAASESLARGIVGTPR